MTCHYNKHPTPKIKQNTNNNNKKIQIICDIWLSDICQVWFHNS